MKLALFLLVLSCAASASETITPRWRPCTVTETQSILNFTDNDPECSVVAHLEGDYWYIRGLDFRNSNPVKVKHIAKRLKKTGFGRYVIDMTSSTEWRKP